jgi:hypothetical protein
LTIAWGKEQMAMIKFGQFLSLQTTSYCPSYLTIFLLDGHPKMHLEKSNCFDQIIYSTLDGPNQIQLLLPIQPSCFQ